MSRGTLVSLVAGALVALSQASYAAPPADDGPPAALPHPLAGPLLEAINDAPPATTQGIRDGAILTLEVTVGAANACLAGLWLAGPDQQRVTAEPVEHARPQLAFWVGTLLGWPRRSGEAAPPRRQPPQPSSPVPAGNVGGVGIGISLPLATLFAAGCDRAGAFRYALPAQGESLAGWRQMVSLRAQTGDGNLLIALPLNETGGTVRGP